MAEISFNNGSLIFLSDRTLRLMELMNIVKKNVQGEYLSLVFIDKTTLFNDEKPCASFESYISEWIIILCTFCAQNLVKFVTCVGDVLNIYLKLDVFVRCYI